MKAVDKAAGRITRTDPELSNLMAEAGISLRKFSELKTRLCDGLHSPPPHSDVDEAAAKIVMQLYLLRPLLSAQPDESEARTFDRKLRSAHASLIAASEAISEITSDRLNVEWRTAFNLRLRRWWFFLAGRRRSASTIKDRLEQSVRETKEEFALADQRAQEMQRDLHRLARAVERRRGQPAPKRIPNAAFGKQVVHQALVQWCFVRSIDPQHLPIGNTEGPLVRFLEQVAELIPGVVPAMSRSNLRLYAAQWKRKQQQPR